MFADQILCENAYTIRLIRSVVGSEDDLIKDLKKITRGAEIFKVFGKYDLLEISKLNQLVESITAVSNEHILSITSLPCFCIGDNVDTAWKDIKRSVSPTLTLIKLQEPVFKQYGLSGIETIVKHFVGIRTDIYCLLGMGFYELLILQPFSDFDQVFNFTEQVRQLKIKDVFSDSAEEYANKSLFSDTTTIPLISYKNVIRPQKWQSLKGTITPIVKIKCAPGQENVIASKWEVNWRQVLGSEDLICIWDHEERLGNFVRDLVEFRRQCTGTSIVLDTSSKIIGKAIQRACDVEDSPGTLVQDPVFFENLRKFRSPGIDQFVITEIINLISLINSNIKNKALKEAYSDIVFSVNMYLISLVDMYISLAETDEYENIGRVKNYLLVYSDCIRAAISQHFPSSDFSDQESVCLPYAGSNSRVVKGLSVIPEQLFSLIAKSKVPEILKEAASHYPKSEELQMALSEFDLPWKGFLFLNLSEGYQIVDQGEIVYVPYKDIFQITNWLTITHEISHAYYCRIKFQVVEEDWVKFVADSLNLSEKENAEFYSSFEDFVYELFAHWFDYRHFFAGDIDFYIWSIWNTWLDNPRIYKHKTHYWIRTVFVRICHSFISIRDELKSILAFGDTEEASTKLNDLITVEINYIAELLKYKFPEKYKKIDLNQEDREEIIDYIFRYLDICEKFEGDYTNYSLIDAVNLSYSGIDKHLTMIRDGIPIKEKIDNPYLLIRELARQVFVGNLIITDTIVVSLIFSLWESSRYYSRPSA